ncbi:MAG: prepilin-type N-terminal cleavage/methylation domain-containing protein [Nitrospirae bacterium]|nr:MAG: prepilin-type N-terminal cleavage/methylation domain-containing protein [Nitrospirota bacterium]
MRQQLSAMLNKKGMTLVEVMIAMLLSLIIFLALMQTSLISINQNMTNNLRDEAGRIADLRMSFLKNLPFDNASLNESPDTSSPADGIPDLEADTTTSRQIRNFNITFTSFKKIDAIGTDIKEITIEVRWRWKNQDFTRSFTSVLKRP